MKRLGIFVFYDEYGVVDEYIPYMLSDLAKNLDRLIIVVNSSLGEDGKRTFENLSTDIIMRDNSGYDTYAYRDGMKHVGWDGLLDYDEVVILNDSIMGPVYPFEEMFDAMSDRDLDFWGITAHYRDELNPYDCPYGYTPEHIQSYFEVFTKRFVATDDFKNYWDNLPEIETYTDAVGKHETVFTRKFADMGYKWGVYVDFADRKEDHKIPIMAYPDEIIKDYRCPIFKKRLFFNEYDWWLDTNVGQTTTRLISYIEKSTDYPISLVIKPMIRTRNLKQVYRNFHWNYILPECIQSGEPEKKPFLLVVSDDKAVSDINERIEDIKTEADIKRIDSQSTFDVIVENLSEQAKDHDVLGLIKDIDCSDCLPQTMREGVFYKEAESLLGHGRHISNAVWLFEENPLLGALTIPTLNNGIFAEYSFDGWNYLRDNQWIDVFEDTKALLEKMEVKVPLTRELPPFVVYDYGMWIKAKAFSDIKGNLIKAYELLKSSKDADAIICRIVPYLLQEQGFFTGHVTSCDFAALEMDNREFRIVDKIKEKNEWYVKAVGEGEALRKQISDMENSKSWKLTAPLRRLKK